MTLVTSLINFLSLLLVFFCSENDVVSSNPKSAVRCIADIPFGIQN